MSETRPRLVAVPHPEEGDAGPGASAPAAGRSEIPWRGLGLGALVLGLGVCALGWASSAQHGRTLEASLQATTAALLEARAELSAYDAHLGGARDQAAALIGQAQALQEQLGELEAFLASGPRPEEPTPEP